MKKLKCLPLIILTLLLAGSVFTACSKINEDHSSLLRDGYIYRVTFNGDGGEFGKARETSIYYREDSFRVIDPEEGNFGPDRVEMFVRGWYYKVPDASGEGFTKKAWSFETDTVTKDMMTEMRDKKTGITFYDFVLYPEWEYYLYVDYYISYVTTDSSFEYINTRSEVVDSEYKKQEDFLSYKGKRITHSSGTAVPEPYNKMLHANIKSASDIMPMFYADEELTQRVTFPLASEYAPLPEQGKNRAKVYVKFFNQSFNILATPNDLSVITDSNYYVWRNIDFAQTNAQGVSVKKSITAAERYEGKVFLGNGYTLSNLSISSTRTSSNIQSLGIFGNIINSEIRDITFENCNVYFNLAINKSDVNCGLIAGSISGSNTKIVDVLFEDVLGFVRNNTSDAVYSPKYNAANEYTYNTSSGLSANAIQNLTAPNSNIHYYNVYMQALDSAEQSGFSVWHSGDVAGKNLRLQFGGLNQELKQRIGTDATRPDYTLAIKISLTEIEDVEVYLFDVNNEISDEFVLDSETGLYVYSCFVGEDVKAGIVTVKWSDELTDEYTYLVTGGSGDLVRASELGADTVPVSYSEAKQTLTYGAGTTIKYNTVAPATGADPLRSRPIGNAIPLRLRLYARVHTQDTLSSSSAASDYKNITVAIEGINGGAPSAIKDLGFKTSPSNAHYIEFWLPVSDGDTKEITVSFYTSATDTTPRYSVTFTVVQAETARFAADPNANATSLIPNQTVAPSLFVLPMASKEIVSIF